ncbi:MAG: NAD(P)-dependent oxidoreductase [Calditrichaceae bacterium]
MNKKVLITGISGFIGQYLWLTRPEGVLLSGTCRQPDNRIQNFFEKPVSNQADVLPYDLLRDPAAQLKEQHPDIIIHAAAMANLGMCEKEPELAARVNAKATEQLAVWSADRGIRLIFLSTDIVFKGDHPPYTEDSRPDPVNVYGKTKLAAESALTDIMKDYATIRIALGLGRGLGKTSNFMDWFLQRLDHKTEIPLFYDEIRTPTAVMYLAEAIWKISLGNETGVFHAAGADSLSRYELGLSMCELLGRGHDLIKPVSIMSMADYRRPVDVSLKSVRTVNGESLSIPGIRQVLNETLKKQSGMGMQTKDVK